MQARASFNQGVLPEVEYELSLGHAPDVAWGVASLRLTEALSEPYECVVEVVTEAPAPRPSALLGSPASVALRRDPLARRVSGVVVSVQDEGSTADRRVFELTIVPWLWLLGQRSHWRVFQDIDALAVVRQVLQHAGVYLGEALVDLVPPGTLAPRECRTQFGESDLAFVRRVLDDEGLAYAFSHDENGERLVIFDPGAIQSLPRVPTLDGASVPVLGEGGATASVESVYRVDSALSIGVEAVALRDHDLTRPFAPQDASHPRGAALPALTRHEYPARFNYVRVDAATGTHPPAATGRSALIRQQTLRAASSVVRGTATVTGLAPGLLVDLDEDAERDLDGRFLVTRVTHVGHCPEVYGAGPAARTEARYCNHFELVPASVVFRTTPAARPTALAPQCAIVAATPGSHDPICTDRLGRVLVRFAWDDRVEPSSEHASCWLRVSQAWAGASMGVSFIPRVGMEVVVQFLDGDPDRPFVAGCLHNAASAPPVELPAHRSRSVIRTQSLPHTGGYNELSFEDLAGREEVSLRAQRDLRELVLHEHHTRVEAHRVSVVGGSAQRHVGGDQSVAIRGAERVDVGGSAQRHVHGEEKVDVDGRMAVTVRRDARVHVNETHHLTTDDGAFIEVGGAARVSVLPDEMTLEAPAGITLRCGENTVRLTPEGITLSTGAATMTLSGAKVSVSASAELDLSGAEVKVEACGPMTINGAKIKIVADGKVVIDGSTVEMNC